MASFHQTKFGRFGKSLPVDMSGYVHTTINGWMSAPVDFGSESLTRSELRSWARDRAAEARKAINEANVALNKWRLNN